MKHLSQRGSVLIAVLWVLIILTILAVSLGRKTQIELVLASNALSQVKAKYLAWTGIVYAMDQLQHDSISSKFKDMDNLYACGIEADEERSAADIFKKHMVGDDGDYFEVGVRLDDQLMDELSVMWGLSDEERKINLNALHSSNYRIFEALLTGMGVDGDRAQMIVFALMDWIDADDRWQGENKGAEEAYYLGLVDPYPCKNGSLNSLEEILLVRGMTSEIFQLIKNYITIFPSSGAFKVNFDTASEAVLRAMFQAKSGRVTGTSEADVDGLVEKILEYRQGSDGQVATADDRMVDVNAMALNAKEKGLFLSTNFWRTKKSRYFSIYSQGVMGSNQAMVAVEAIVRRDDLSIVHWRVSQWKEKRL